MPCSCRAEIEAGEQALEAMSSQLSEAKAAAEQAESKVCRGLSCSIVG